MRRLALLVVAATLVFPGKASAATSINLGTAAQYSVLGGQTVTNTGATTLAGGLGVFPGSAFTGFPPGEAPFVQAATAEALQAETDLTAAYLDAFLQVSTTTNAQLGGLVLVPGVYSGPVRMPLAITGTLTLDGPGTYIFQTDSTLITASGSRVELVNGARPCDVFWQVGSSATLGTGSSFVGTIMALTSITVTTGVTIQGRALARNGSTTLDSDTFLTPGCSAPPATTIPPAETVPVETAPTVPESVTVPPTLPGVSVPGNPTTALGVPPILTSVTLLPGVSLDTTTTAGGCTTKTGPELVIPCPKQKSHEFVYAMTGIAVGGCVCGGAVMLLRFLRRRPV